MKIATTIAWGGSDEDETFLDVLNTIQKNAPTARFQIVDAYPNHTGGWPLVEIEFDEVDLGWISEHVIG